MKFILVFFVFLLFYNICNGQFSREVDKFNDEIICRYGTPSIIFSKIIRTKSSPYFQDTSYVSGFYLYNTYLTASGNDAVLLFSDSTTIRFEGVVDVIYSHGNYYKYSFYVNEKEIVEKLSTTSLNGFKLHTFEKKLNKSDKITIMTAAKKILNSK